MTAEMDDLYRRHDEARVLAQVTARYATLAGSDPDPQLAAVERAEAALAAIVAGGHTAPSDVATTTAAYVATVREMHASGLATTEDNLALSAEQAALQGIDLALEARKQELWIHYLAAFDEVTNG